MKLFILNFENYINMNTFEQFKDNSLQKSISIKEHKHKKKMKATNHE